MMRKISTYLGIGIIGILLVCGFIAYFITKIDIHTREIYDGFGRILTESPVLIRFIFGQDRLWPGWGWFIGDMVIFWGGIGIAMMLINIGSSESKK